MGCYLPTQPNITRYTCWAPTKKLGHHPRHTDHKTGPFHSHLKTLFLLFLLFFPLITAPPENLSLFISQQPKAMTRMKMVATTGPGQWRRLGLPRPTRDSDGSNEESNKPLTIIDSATVKTIPTAVPLNTYQRRQRRTARRLLPADEATTEHKHPEEQ